MQPLPKLVWHFLLCLLKFAWFDSVNYIHYFHYEIFIILHLQWSLAFLFHYCFKHRILHVLHSGHILMTSLWRQWHHVSVIGPDKLWHVVLVSPIIVIIHTSGQQHRHMTLIDCTGHMHSVSFSSWPEFELYHWGSWAASLSCSYQMKLISNVAQQLLLCPTDCAVKNSLHTTHVRCVKLTTSNLLAMHVNSAVTIPGF